MLVPWNFLRGVDILEIKDNLFEIYNNQNVTEYTLDNGQNFQVKILSLGATIREINYKGKNRVLGFDNVKDYLNVRTYFGALVGRVAGRISGGEIDIGGEKYVLDQNEGTTCLHGGKEGFSFKIWELVHQNITDESASITLKYISPDIECGFPGELTVIVRYTIYKDDSLKIEYFANTTKETPITLTNHSYFNLNDDLKEDILNHRLRIDSNNFIRLDKKGIPIEVANVANTPFDFVEGKSIGKDMDLTHEDLKFTEGYDHPFILNKDSNNQIELYSNKSGVKLFITTTEPVVILYCSNKLDGGYRLSEGEKTFKYQGVCLETQWYPDVLNQDFLPDNRLKPGEEYYSKTIYEFKSIY